MQTKELQKLIDQNYQTIFGSTPLTERLKDIEGEARELSRYVSLANLREEAGDLLCSTIQLINECGFNVEDLVQENIEKINRRRNQYRALGRKYSICILGGAFDPPTLGHIAVAKYVLDTTSLFDEVHLMPCFKHMYSKQMIAAEHRLEMCRITAKTDGRIKVSDFEIRNELAGDTYCLVKRLLDTPEFINRYDFSFIIGLDNALTIHKWVNSVELERMVRFVVVPRTGVVDDPTVTWFRRPPHIWIPHDDKGKIGVPDREISSTLLRECIRKIYKGSFVGETGIDNYVDPEVKRYIFQNGLYKGEQQ